MLHVIDFKSFLVLYLMLKSVLAIVPVIKRLLLGQLDIKDIGITI